ncbi:MAG: LemA family protein [Candidatus Symbiothrix sp.]|jgi:hypothetical protein|nr:LemA family protein [Candidatus Symbiothrix sp.]
MKVLKWFLGMIASILVAIIVLTFIYNHIVKSNLVKYENDVHKNWTELFTSSTERLIPLESYLVNDSTIYGEVLKNSNTRNQYKDKCSEEYVYLEYELNKSLIAFLDSLDMSSEKNFLLKEEFIRSSSKLNKLAKTYNQSVFVYNSYMYQFPNIIIAKRNNFKIKEQFTIKYGAENKDPILQKQEMIESMRKVVDDNI